MLMNFFNLMKKKNGKTTELCQKVDCWLDQHEVCGCHGNAVAMATSNMTDKQMAYPNFYRK